MTLTETLQLSQRAILAISRSRPCASSMRKPAHIPPPRYCATQKPSSNINSTGARSSSACEARYLVAILNSETARERVEAYQSRGQWGARDFDKVIFNLPIPRFDAEKQNPRRVGESRRRRRKNRRRSRIAGRRQISARARFGSNGFNRRRRRRAYRRARRSIARPTKSKTFSSLKARGPRRMSGPRAFGSFVTRAHFTSDPA